MSWNVNALHRAVPASTLAAANPNHPLKVNGHWGGGVITPIAANPNHPLKVTGHWGGGVIAPIAPIATGMRWNAFALQQAARASTLAAANPNYPLKINGYRGGGVIAPIATGGRMSPSAALEAAALKTLPVPIVADRAQSPAQMVAQAPDNSIDTPEAKANRLKLSGMFSANASILDDREQVVNTTKLGDAALKTSVGMKSNGTVVYPSFLESFVSAWYFALGGKR